MGVGTGCALTVVEPLSGVPAVNALWAACA